MPNRENSEPQSDERLRRIRQLQRLGVRRGLAGLKVPAPVSGETPPRAGHPAPPAPPGARPPIEELVGAREITTEFGPCLVAETSFSLHETRGGWALGALLEISPAAVAAGAHDEALARFSLGRAAFIDTETTGLSGGAGTLAFQVGIGTFETDSAGNPTYGVHQVFMRHPGEEGALLEATRQILARCDGLVSFNGRAFDAPLLAGRYVMHRQPSPLEGLPHLDLLPLARRRWRLRLPSCALGALEQDILAFQRSQEDVPGWLIPSLYQDYARGGDSEPMARVFYHNREDIVSMVPLAAALCWPYEAGGQALDRQALHPVDLVGLGHSFEALGWLEAGEQAYRHALEYNLPPSIHTRTLSHLGRLLKRQDRRPEAVALWQGWITSASGIDLEPYVELAMHHEWHDVDLAAARKWALWGLHTARQLPPTPQREQALAELQHRLERLERKMAG